MGTKTHPGRFDCYANAKPDEPMFVLLARDPSAAILVRLWATMREAEIRQGRRPESDRLKVGEAYACATDMERWHDENRGRR